MTPRRRGLGLSPALVLAALCSCGLVESQSVERDFCSQSGQSLTLTEGKLYINGGWQLWRYGIGLENYSGPVDFMRTIDVTKEFQVTTDISTYAPATTLPDSVPRLDGGVYWPTDEGFIDVMQGAQQVTTAAMNAKKIPDQWFPDDKYRFNTKSEEWTKEKTTLDGWSEKQRNAMTMSRGTVWVPRRKMGFVVGGEWYSNNVAKDNSVAASLSMMVYEHEKKTWRTEPLPHTMMENVPVVHLPAGDDDLIIALGGPKLSDKSQFEFRMLSMRTVYIYSINKQKWYKHIIPSGNQAPQRRGAYCSTILSSPDRTSHQLLIMGGITGPESNSNVDGAATDPSVWALNIPSMHWTQLPGTSATGTRGLVPGGRNSPACAAIGKGYVLLSGGRKVTEPFERPVCDSAGNNIFLFNVNTGQWVETFNTSQKYKVPVIIENAGNVPLSAPPIEGYSDSSLNDILKFPAQPNASTDTPTDTDSSPQSAASSAAAAAAAAPGKKTNTIAIAVGTSVGIVGGIIIIAVIIWEIRRRKQRIPEPEHTHLELPSQASPDPYYHQQQQYYGQNLQTAYHPESVTSPYDGWPKEEQERWHMEQAYRQGQYSANELTDASYSSPGSELPGSQLEYMEMASAGHEPVEAHSREYGHPRSMDVGALLAERDRNMAGGADRITERGP